MNLKKDNLPLLLLILDGWGIAPPNEGNAITLAKTPYIDSLLKDYPAGKLFAHGKYAGLPEGQIGNSEAGHMNIGAGRLVEQDSVRISKSIAKGTFFKNSAFMGAIRHVRKKKSKMHVMGMLSNGQSPHSDPRHLFAILDMLKKHKIEQVHLHLFTDGRDSPKYAALQLVDELEKKFFNNEKIATIIGRFYAMDRKKKWERTELSFKALATGQGKRADSAKAAITAAYNRGNTDEFIEPCIIYNKESILQSRIDNGDSVIFFNLRSDRARQLAKAFVQEDFEGMNPDAFKRHKKLDHLYFVAMTDFGPDLDDIMTAYPGEDLHDTLPFVLAGLKQLYIAETEKYAHVTYFFNGGFSGTVAGEEQFMIDSPDVRSYDLAPVMSSRELARTVAANLDKGQGGVPKYDFTCLNLAAPDMVGHTGNLPAGIECCQGVDACVRQIVEAYLAKNGAVVMTADHGNIEKMKNLETGEIYTEHTTNQVPFAIINNDLKNKIKIRKKGILGDIAPTILKLMDIKKPAAMTGKPLY